MSYKWVKTGTLVLRLSDKAFIPEDARNLDWQEFQAWVGLGNAPESADAQPTLNEIAADEVDSRDRLLFEINFDQENRIRQLEGRQTVTRAAYRGALIQAWKDLNV